MTGKSKQSKQSKTSNATTQETAPVVQEPTVQEPTVQETVATPAPVVSSKNKKTKGKSTAEVTATVAEVTAPASEVTAPASEVTAPASEVTAPASEVTAPVAEVTAPASEVTAPASEVTPKRKRKVARPLQLSDSEATPKRRLRVTTVEQSTTEVVDEGEDADQTSGRHLRSFKVRLPNKEEYEGRFTGLTPYQAANKALSKYFRETDNPLAEVTFSICESTRKSKKSVYTYVGKRLRLEVPVRYTIDGGREIVKNFKNSLKKVKKQHSDVVVGPEA
jgi:hypothetical protein